MIIHHPWQSCKVINILVAIFLPTLQVNVGAAFAPTVKRGHPSLGFERGHCERVTVTNPRKDGNSVAAIRIESTCSLGNTASRI